MTRRSKCLARPSTRMRMPSEPSSAGGFLVLLPAASTCSPERGSTCTASLTRTAPGQHVREAAVLRSRPKVSVTDGRRRSASISSTRWPGIRGGEGDAERHRRLALLRHRRRHLHHLGRHLAEIHVDGVAQAADRLAVARQRLVDDREGRRARRSGVLRGFSMARQASTGRSSTSSTCRGLVKPGVISSMPTALGEADAEAEEQAQHQHEALAGIGGSAGRHGLGQHPGLGRPEAGLLLEHLGAREEVLVERLVGRGRALEFAQLAPTSGC